MASTERSDYNVVLVSSVMYTVVSIDSVVIITWLNADIFTDQPSNILTLSKQSHNQCIVHTSSICHNKTVKLTLHEYFYESMGTCTFSIWYMYMYYMMCSRRQYINKDTYTNSKRW